MSAWFVIADSGRWAGDTFVVQIDDAAKVQYAREVLAGGHADAPSLGGVITKSSMDYNIGWSFHIAPEDVIFFGPSAEVGDAAIRYVEKHLDEAGGAFLPGLLWTPWGVALSHELAPLFGGSGADELAGGAGHDLILGGDGHDQLAGGGGDDVVNGQLGRDWLDGAAGSDKLDGGAGSDRLGGGDGADTVIGAGNGDLISGGVGNDDLRGGSGDDELTGDAGGDLLAGQGGDDRLDGGAGADKLFGGKGSDAFLFSGAVSSLGADWIRDFDSGEGDSIDLSGLDADAGKAGNQAFRFVAQFGGSAGEAVLAYEPGLGRTLLRVDVNGDAVADWSLAINGHASAADPGWVL